MSVTKLRDRLRKHVVYWAACLPSRVGMSGVKDLRLLQRMAAGLPAFNEGG